MSVDTARCAAPRTSSPLDEADAAPTSGGDSSRGDSPREALPRDDSPRGDDRCETHASRASTVWLPLACLVTTVATAMLAPAGHGAPIAWSALIAAAAGLSATSIGVYGGVLVPGLLLLDVDARFAAAASLFLQVLVIPLGVGAHWKLGNVRRHVVMPLILGGVVGAFTGPFVATSLPKTIVVRVVAGTIVLIGVLVLATARWSGRQGARATEQVSGTSIGGVGLVAGFASGVSGAGWGPIGVKLHFLLGIEPRQAIGSSLVGRVFMAIAAVIGYVASSAALDDLSVDPWLLAPLLFGSLATMIPGAALVSRLDRGKAVVVVSLVSIALALPSLWRGH